MKKIFFLVVFTISFLITFSQSQYPISQNLGAPKTLVAVKGGIMADSSLIIPNFPDTAAANKSTYINKYPGSLIRVVDSLYMRDFQSSKWIRVGVDANVTNAYVSSQQITPYTFLLCRTNGSCDTINIATANMTMLISGSAVWSGTGLTYNVTNCTYYILGTLYNSSATSITLTPSDPTNPRIDVIYLDTAGNVGVLTGNPSPDPVKPVVNPISQIELTHIYISAGAVTPPNVYNKLVYNENLQVPTEWNTPGGDILIDYAYTAFPYVGSKSAYAPQSSVISNDAYVFTNNVPVSADTISFLTMYVRLRGTILDIGKGIFVIELGNTSTGNSSNFIAINDGSYGFDQNLIGSYQLISIPMTDFSFSIDKTFDKISMYISADITNGMQLDFVNLQSGSAVPPIVGNYWSLSGNDVSSITSPKLGTTSNNPLSIVTNDIERINISDTGLVKVTNLQTHISQDTTTNKPVGVNANGELVKMDNWAAGEIYTENPILATVRNDSNIIYFNPDTAAVWRSGGTTPTLQQVTDVGDTTTNELVVTDGSNTSVMNSFAIGNISSSGQIGAIGSGGVSITTPYYANPISTLYFDTQISYAQQPTGHSTYDRSITLYPIYPTDTSHYCYFPQTVPTQLTDTIATLRDIRAGGGGSGTVTSVGLTMPSAFTVSNSPITNSGNIGVTGAGTTAQYVRGDGTLGIFPSVGGGGGGTVYYLNGNTSQGSIGGTTMYQLSKDAGTGAAANFSGNVAGTIASFITNVGDPNQLTIPSGIWVFECYLSETGGGSNHAQISANVLKWNGTTLTSISTGPIEEIANGNVKDLYQFGVTIPSGTTLALTDRIVVQIVIANPNGKTVTLYTEDSNLSSVTTTFANGISSLNGLTASAQTFATGTSGTDFNISSSTSIHTFNLPDASATARGVITTGSQTIAGQKTFTSNIKIPNAGTPLILAVASDNTVSGLTTSTYPSLTELSYVKGTTSAIQTQINNKLNISDTSTMLTNYVRGSGALSRLTFWNDNRTLSSTGNLLVNSTTPSITTYASALSVSGTLAPTLIKTGRSTTDDYIGLVIDTTTNLPYLLNHNNSSNKESRLYPTYLQFKNLTGGSVININAPTSTSNRTINIQDASGTLMLTGDTASISSRIDTKIGGSGTTGSISKFATSTTLTNATADVDYLQQDMSLVAYQAMGSSIKGYTLQCPNLSAITTVAAPSTGTVFFIACYIPKAVTLTGIKWYQSLNAIGASTAYNGVGLYSASGGTLTLVASSTDDATCWTQGTNGWRSKAFSSTYSASAGLYYISFVMNYNTSGATVGVATAATNQAVKNADFTNNNKFSGTLTSQTFPSTQALSGTTTNNGNHAFYVY